MTVIRRDIAAVVSGNRGRNALHVFIPPDWTLDAACAEIGPDLFFPDEHSPNEGTGTNFALAKQICAGCPVRQECLDYALAYESGEMGVATSQQSGIYGGLSPRQRLEIIRERRGPDITSEAS